MVIEVSPVSNLKIRKVKNSLFIFVNPLIYKLDTIFSVANNFIGKAYVAVSGGPSGEIIVCLRKRGEETDLQKLGMEFRNQLSESNVKKELNRFIQDLGVLQEKFSVLKNNEKVLDIRNYYNQKMTKDDLNKIKFWVKLIDRQTKDGLRAIKNIFVIPGIGKLPTGELQNGECNVELNSIMLYPAAFQKSKYRIENVNNLLGVLVHEWAHQYLGRPRCSFLSSLYKEWTKIGGWHVTREFKQGIYEDDYTNVEMCSKPKECLNEHSRLNSCEDFAECVVASLLNPKIIQKTSPRKFRFIKNKIINSSSRQLKENYRIKESRWV